MGAHYDAISRLIVLCRYDDIDTFLVELPTQEIYVYNNII